MSYINGYTPDSHSGGGDITSLDSPSQSHSAGNTILVAVRSVAVSNGAPVSVSSITDTAGNTYARVGSPVTTDSVDTTELWMAASETAEASNVVTVHWSTATNYARMIVAQYSGDIGDEVDYDVTVDASSTTSHSGGSVTTTADGALVVGLGFSYSGGADALTGTGDTVVRSQGYSGGTSSYILDIEDAAAGSHAITASSVSSFQALFLTAAFQVAAGAAVTCAAAIGASAARRVGVGATRGGSAAATASRRAAAAVTRSGAVAAQAARRCAVASQRAAQAGLAGAMQRAAGIVRSADMAMTASWERGVGAQIVLACTVAAAASRQAAAAIYRSAIIAGSPQVRRAVSALRGAMRAMHATMWTGDAPITVREFVRRLSLICQTIARPSRIAQTINLASPINLEDDSP